MLDGLDSLLSIVQMPAGVPVATVAVGGARNAGLLAVRILAAADEALRARMQAFQASLQATVLEKDAPLRATARAHRRACTGCAVCRTPGSRARSGTVTGVCAPANSRGAARGGGHRVAVHRRGGGPKLNSHRTTCEVAVR